MNWGIVIRESLAIGAVLSAVLTILIVVSLMLNKEMWLQDYPPDVRAKWGPISEKAKRQRFVFAICIFGVLIGAMAYDVIRQVVGFYSDSESLAGDISGKLVHPFVLAPDGKTFTDFDVPQGVGKTFAQTIDDTGQVIGHYVDASGNNHGFIATPVR
jgi:hypothetical protein